MSTPTCAASFLPGDCSPTTDITRPGPGAMLTQKAKLHGSKNPFLRPHRTDADKPVVYSVLMEVKRDTKI